MNEILLGDALDVLRTLPDESVQCCVTSPPYFGLRNYGSDSQIGMEATPEEYVAKIVAVFREVRRVLKADGTLWLNLGDSYAGSGMGSANYPESAGQKQTTNRGAMTAKGRSGLTYGLKPKDLIGIPWMAAFALRSDGWYLRSEIIWAKPNPMPESVRDRPTKAHEYIFLLSKSARYYYNANAIREKLAATSIARLAQNVEEPTGSDRVHGKTNGNMKAVKFGGNNPCPDTRLQSGKEWRPYQGGSGFTPEKRNTVGADTLTANKKSVWTVATQPFKEAHFATYPQKLIVPCIKAGSPEGGVVLDPFMGSGTTAVVAKRLGRQYLGIELNPEYIAMAKRRIRALGVSLFD